MSNDLKSRAMLISFTRHEWQGQRLDKEVSKEVTEQKNAEEGSGKFITMLVPKKDIDAVRSTLNAAYLDHIRLTLPWADKGPRIITAMAFMPEYRDKMAEHRSKVDAAVRHFADIVYPNALASAPQRLNGLYRPKDFPTADEIRHRFGFDIHISPLGDADDFRVNMGKDVEDEIRSNIQSTFNEQLSEAQRNLWESLLKEAKHLVEATHKDRKKFYDSSISNLRDVARLAPKLNVMGDPAVDAISREVFGLLDSYTSSAIREDKKVRSKAHKDAEAVAKRIEDAMKGAFC